MKKIYLILSMVVLAFSCQDVEKPNLGVDSQWLQFEFSSQTTFENAGEPLMVPVLYSAAENTSGVDISFSYTASTMDGYTVSPASGVLNIPAGEFVGYILVTPIDDTTSGEDVVLNFSMQNSSSIPMGIAGEGVYNTTAEVTILEDDCPIPINDWVGTYSVDEQFTGGVNAPNGLSDFFSDSYEVELSLAPGDASGTKVVINNTAGSNIYIYDGTVMTFVTCNKEVQFDAGFPVVADWNVFEFTSSSFDQDALTIKCSGPLQGFGPYEFVLTKI